MSTAEQAMPTGQDEQLRDPAKENVPEAQVTRSEE